VNSETDSRGGIRYWTPDEDALLGTMPDKKLARWLNRDISSTIIVGVTFKNLSNEVKKLFSPYFQGKELTVERVFS
jgi:hypothetical protein